MNMKYLLLGLMLMVMPLYAEVGTHNFVLKAGGGVNLSTRQFIKGLVPDFQAAAFKEKMQGGIVSVDMGYQYFHTSDSFVQGIDALVGFSYSFTEMVTKGGVIVKTYPGIGTQVYHLGMFGSVSSTYSIGKKFSKSRLMFDVLGLHMMFGDWTFQFNVPIPPPVSLPLQDANNFESIMKNAGTVFSIGLNLPLAPQYIMDNGFIVALRHSITFLLPMTNGENGQHGLKDSKLNKRTADYISYNVQFSIGFMVGG